MTPSAHHAQPAGRQLFVPVPRERFHAFEVADLERQLQAAQPALKSAQDVVEALDWRAIASTVLK